MAHELKNDPELDTPSLESGPDEKSEAYRQLSKRVLWKLDIHVLPPLALVGVIGLLFQIIAHFDALDSFGWPTSSTVPMSGMLGSLIGLLPRLRELERVLQDRRTSDRYSSRR